jgi:hypothetical protein
MLFPGPGGPLIVILVKNRAKRMLPFTHRRVSGIGKQLQHVRGDEDNEK